MNIKLYFTDVDRTIWGSDHLLQDSSFLYTETLLYESGCVFGPVVMATGLSGTIRRSLMSS